MSLISDALKKARQEAARQDSLRQGLPYAMGAVDPPVRRNPWISLLAGLSAGCILAVAMFALAYFTGWGPFHKPAVETRVAAAPVPAASPSVSPAVPVAAPAAPATVPAALPAAPKTKPAPEARQTRPVPAAPVAEPIVSVHPVRPEPRATLPPESSERADRAPVELRPAPAPVQTPSAPSPAPPAPAAPAGDSPGLVDGKVYIGEVPVPGGGSVKINGIAFSQDQPVAVLDGRVMGPGESVGGFTLVAIESGRVKLQGHGATVYLSPK
jgi:hypothetical protein